MKAKVLKLALFDESLFRCCYLASFFFYMISYLSTFSIVLIGITSAWGVVLAIRSLVVNKAYLRIYYGFWLGAFLLSLTFTLLFNLSTDFIAVGYNFILIVHTFICFILFYGMHIHRGTMYRWEMYLFSRFFIYAATVTAFVGLVFMLFGFKVAFYGKTFTGVFFNPNYQGYVSALSIIFCHFMTKPDFLSNARQKRISRIWITACVLLNLIALVLSNSNGSLLLLGIYVAFMVLLRLLALSEKLTPRKLLTRFLALVAVGFLLICLLMALRAAFKIVVAVLSSPEGELSKADINTLTKGSFFNIVTDTGLSSRLDLWGAGLKALLSNPVFGAGKGDLYNHIVEAIGQRSYFTDDYLTNVFIADMHNGYLGVLVVSGILGFGLFGVFMYRFFSMTLPAWFVQRRIMTYSIYPSMIGFVAAYLVYALIERTILFDLSFIVTSFWAIIGYMSCYATDLGYNIRGTTDVFGLKVPKRLF